MNPSNTVKSNLHHHFAIALLLLAATFPASAQLDWSYPKLVNDLGVLTSGWRDDSHARVATDGQGTWIAVWRTREAPYPAVGDDEDLLFARSTNDGAAWTASQPLNSYATMDNDAGFVDQEHDLEIATDGDGTWLCAWDTGLLPDGSIGDSRVIMVARSTDNGATWSDPVIASDEIDVGANIVARDARLAPGANDTWVLAWRMAGTMAPYGYDDVFVATSTDDGVSWSNTTDVSNTTLRGESAPAIASDEAGHFIVTFDWNQGTDNGPAVVHGTNNGLTWSAPEFTIPDYPNVSTEEPALATDGKGTWLSICVTRTTPIDNIDVENDEDLLVVRSTDDGDTWHIAGFANADAATEGGVDDHTPRLATDTQGNWMAVWETTQALRALSAFSSNDGTDWTDPAPVNSQEDAGVGNDQLPDIATDGKGVWLTVWETSQPFGTYATDYDIYTANIGAENATDPTDVNNDGVIDAVDVQLVINGALGLATAVPTDVNGDNTTDAVDVQFVINAALGL